MGFLEKLKLKDWLSARNAPTRKAVLYTVDDATGEAVPVAAGQLGGGGGGGSDPASAREATLELVRLLLADTNSHAQAANGNTYILASQAQDAGLKVQLPAGAATDAKAEAIRALLAGRLNVDTGLTGLATQATLEAVRALLAGTLSVSDAKSEAIRALLAGTLKTAEQVTAPGTLNGDIPANSSTGAAMNAAGLSGVRLVIGASWTAADLSFETSTDGATWVPLYDAYGSLIVYKAAAGRSINVPVGDLLRLNRVRVRSGVPGAYVTQTALSGVTLVTAGL